jgi:hypothetical protein
MSREERRQYQRQMKSMERGPSLPPAARGRAERNAARREARRSRDAASTGTMGVGDWVRTVLLAALIGYFGFSLQWGEGMPRAAIVGVIVAVVALVLLVAIRLLRSRIPTPPLS